MVNVQYKEAVTNTCLVRLQFNSSMDSWIPATTASPENVVNGCLV